MQQFSACMMEGRVANPSEKQQQTSACFDNGGNPSNSTSGDQK
jgi:hypothetical protein